VALKTSKFRIAALGNLEKNGKIDLQVNAVELLTQGMLKLGILKGNIKKPKTAHTNTTIVNIVESIPSSILGTSKKILDFSTKTVDSVASFGVQKVLRTDKRISIVSDTVSEGSSLLSSTSKIIMPKGCDIVYDGKVKHPKKE